MKNEPVSHQYVSVLERIVVRQVAEIEHLKELFGCDPAYYEKSAKTLTDEEILDFINAFCTDMGDYWDLNENNAVPMIRAILRKAQE